MKKGILALCLMTLLLFIAPVAKDEVNTTVAVVTTPTEQISFEPLCLRAGTEVLCEGDPDSEQGASCDDGSRLYEIHVSVK